MRCVNLQGTLFKMIYHWNIDIFAVIKMIKTGEL